jgi:hypothetical protein
LGRHGHRGCLESIGDEETEFLKGVFVLSRRGLGVTENSYVWLGLVAVVACGIGMMPNRVWVVEA